MKLFATVLAVATTVMLLTAILVVQLVVTMLPFMAIVTVVVLALRARSRSSRQASYAPRPNPVVPLMVTPVTAPAGWVMVPVWPASPPPGPRVIDADGTEHRD